MAAYKIIQDVEAEDMILWRLSLRQVIYGLVGAGLLGLGYLIGRSDWLLAAPCAILAAPFIFLALPLGRDQPNDAWLLGKLNFLLRPQRRLWRQVGAGRQFVVIAKAKTSTRAADPAADPADIAAHIQDLSGLLDSRGQTAVAGQANSPDWEKEHDKRHSALGRRFQRLLHQRHHQRRTKISNHFNRQLHGGRPLRRPSKPLQPLQPEQTLRPQQTAVRFDTIKKLAVAEDLSVATLESLARRDRQQASKGLRGGQRRETAKRSSG